MDKKDFKDIRNKVIAGIILFVITLFITRILGMWSLIGPCMKKVAEFLTIPIDIHFWVLCVLTIVSVLSIKRYYCSSRLKHLLINRRYLFTYNDDGRNKEIGFGHDGKICPGGNDNEYSWSVSGGKLKIYAADGKIYSRFTYSKELDKFFLIKDPQNRSLPKQRIEPNSKVTDWAKQNKIS